jgi:hypothetical protein
MFIIECRIVINIWRHRPICFKHVSIWCLLFDPHQNTYQSNLAVRLRKVATYDPCTLHTLFGLAFPFPSQTSKELFVRGGPGAEDMHLHPTNLCTLVGAWPWSSPEAKPSSLSLGQIIRHKIRKLSGPSLSTRGGHIATHSSTWLM